MGTEYYVVKPSKKEIFYLGKHMNCPEGMACKTYNSDADYMEYDCFDDFFWDFLRENYYEFATTDYTLDKISNLIHNLYIWCEYEKVYFDNDCNNDAEWKNWKETGSLFIENEESNYEEDLKEINRELVYRDIYESHVTTEEDKAKILEIYPHFAEPTPMDSAKYLFDGNEKKADIFLGMLWDSKK